MVCVLLRELELAFDDADGKVRIFRNSAVFPVKQRWNLREDEIDILLAPSEDGGADGDIESIVVSQESHMIWRTDVLR